MTACSSSHTSEATVNVQPVHLAVFLLLCSCDMTEVIPACAGASAASFSRRWTIRRRRNDVGRCRVKGEQKRCLPTEKKEVKYLRVWALLRKWKQEEEKWAQQPVSYNTEEKRKQGLRNMDQMGFNSLTAAATFRNESLTYEQVWEIFLLIIEAAGQNE